MTMRRTLAVLLVAAVCAWATIPALAAPGGPAGTTAVPGPAKSDKEQGQSVTKQSHPVVQEAIKELEHTKTLLVKEAAQDFQGHRTKAVQGIDQALQELRMALQVDKK
jgi:hypothetical protein